MIKMTLQKGNMKIGAFLAPGKKKPMIGVMIDNQVICYGHFNSRQAADDFMDELAEFVGAKRESEDESAE